MDSLSIRRRRQRRCRLPNAPLSGGSGNGRREEEFCDCHARRTWEPVDLEKLLPKEMVATLTASLIAVASTVKDGCELSR